MIHFGEIPGTADPLPRISDFAMLQCLAAPSGRRRELDRRLNVSVRIMAGKNRVDGSFEVR